MDARFGGMDLDASGDVYRLEKKLRMKLNGLMADFLF